MFGPIRQLAWESLVYGLSGMVSRFLSILLVPIYTRIFTPEDYGVLGLVTTTMTAISIFAVLALDTSAGRWYWDTENNSDRKSTLASWAWCHFGVALVLALIVFSSAAWLGQTVVGRGDAGMYFQLTALSLPLSVLGIVTTNWLRMRRRPWATTFYSLGTSVLNVLLTVMLVVFLGWGLRGIFVAQLLSMGVSTVVAVRLLGDWIHPRHFNLERLRAMMRFGLPLIPTSLAFWIVAFSDRYFVEFYTSTSEVGLYQVGSAMAAVVALGTSAFQQAWGPFAMSIHKSPDARQIYADVLLIYLWLTCAVSAAIGLLAPEAIGIIATEQYLGASPVVPLLAFSYVMIGLGYVAAVGPTIAKSTAPTGLAVTMAAGLNIGLNLLLVPHLGKTGAAMATLISQSIVPLFVFYRSQQMYPIPYRFGSALGILALSSGLIWLGASWQFENLWLGILAKGLLLTAFIPALFLFGIVTPAQAKRFVASHWPLGTTGGAQDTNVTKGEHPNCLWHGGS